MKRAYLQYGAALLLFGSNGIVASGIGLASYEIVFYRTLIGSLFLSAVFWLTGHKPTVQHCRRDLLLIALSGICMGASWMFLYEAYAQAGVGLASLLYYCGPVLVMLASPFLFREKLTRAKCAGFALVLCGAVLINGAAAGGGNARGLFCGLMSAVLYAGMIVFQKKTGRVTGLENAALQLWAGFFTVAAFVWIRGGVSLPDGTGEWVRIGMLGLLNTGAGCWMYFSALGRLPVQTVAVCGYAEPLAAVALSALLLHEALTAAQLVGAGLLVGGAALCELNPKRRGGAGDTTPFL